MVSARSPSHVTRRANERAIRRLYQPRQRASRSERARTHVRTHVRTHARTHGRTYRGSARAIPARSSRVPRARIRPLMQHRQAIKPIHLARPDFFPGVKGALLISSYARGAHVNGNACFSVINSRSSSSSPASLFSSFSSCSSSSSSSSSTGRNLFEDTFRSARRARSLPDHRRSKLVGHRSPASSRALPSPCRAFPPARAHARR